MLDLTREAGWEAYTTLSMRFAGKRYEWSCDSDGLPRSAVRGDFPVATTLASRIQYDLPDMIPVLSSRVYQSHRVVSFEMIFYKLDHHLFWSYIYRKWHPSRAKWYSPKQDTMASPALTSI